MSAARRNRTKGGLGRFAFGRPRTQRIAFDDVIAVHLHLGQGGRNDHDQKIARTMDRLRRENA